MKKIKDANKNFNEIISIFENSQIEFAYIFGSFGTENQGLLSDIDIAAYSNPSLSKYERHKLRLSLMALIGDIYKTNDIDLVILNDAPILLAVTIIRTGKCFFSKNERIHQDFIERSIMQSLDFAYFADQFDNWQAKSLLRE